MDISPDEVRLLKTSSTQTIDIDYELLSEARNIISNFEKIEKYWQTREERVEKTAKIANYAIIIATLYFSWKLLLNLKILPSR